MANQDTFYFFAYACSLNLALMEFRVNEPINTFEKGVLKNYTLCFNRPNPDGSARANIKKAPSEYIYGIIYTIHQQHFELLCQTEPSYNLVEMAIETLDGGTKSAFVFKSEECDEHVSPENDYLQLIIDGAIAHQLPQEYIDRLKEKVHLSKAS